jgi:hypothetical protein
MINEESNDFEAIQLEIPEEVAELTKEEKADQKNAIEREVLLNKLAESNLDGVREKVAFILNHYPETRNSDNALVWRFWKVFEPEHAGSGAINQEKMQRLRGEHPTFAKIVSLPVVH